MTSEDRARERRLYEKDYCEWTDDDVVWMLTRRYTADEVPPCHICGGALSPQSMGGGRPTTWACDGREDDPDRPGHWRWQEGRGVVDDHYKQSYWTQHRTGDGLVLDALRRLQAALEWKRQAKETGILGECYCGEVTQSGIVHRECRDKHEQEERRG